jgi:hypothetical protein
LYNKDLSEENTGENLRMHGTVELSSSSKYDPERR